MSRPKVGAIGALIVIAFILTCVSVFSKSWIVVSTPSILHQYVSANVGIVPYRSGEYGWFAAASWMMFISFGLFFPLILIYLHASYKVHHHGCCHSIRHNFNGISLLCSVIVILQAVAFILMAVNASGFIPVLDCNVGFSAYLGLSSAIFATIAMALAGHVSRHHCH